MNVSRALLKRTAMLKAALVVGISGCVLALSLADSVPDERTIDPKSQSSEFNQKDAIKDDGQQSGDAKKKKSPFGAKTKGPVGKALLETKRPFVKEWKVDDLLKKTEGGLS